MSLHLPFSRFSDYFIAVAQTGNLRKAAEQCYISVSAVHRQIVLAETQLGIPLFERLPSGLKLTLAGELLYADLLRWQKDFQQTQNRFHEIQGLQRGQVNWGLISALSEDFCHQALLHFRQHYPWINFNVHILESERIAQMVMQNDIDFGLILNPQQQQHLKVDYFIEVPLGFVIPKQHVLAQHKKIRFADTLEQSHLLATAALTVHAQIDAWYKKHRFQPRHSLQCNDIRMMIALLKQNYGIAILSYLDVYPWIISGDFIFQPIIEPGLPPLTLALCTAPKRQISRVAQMMMSLLIEKMQYIKHSIPATQTASIISSE
ncbi:LysR family transcriptional regulator [Acinetobacter larvae]|uniref:LysR family transcriptional regulator n=1 Tax=Acinetobacter larvae TaxID=1789224 RepID=A0A1B2LYT3_9GAMM|nr:LysR family transcriptional regulator [Acinetobacter larvae]AOA58086.1 LysR family transcriptional regulator [Acinetobacter larvae]